MNLCHRKFSRGPNIFLRFSIDAFPDRAPLPPKKQNGSDADLVSVWGELGALRAKVGSMQFIL